MSRAYRIRVSETIERVVHVDDGVATTLELLPVLPAERMRELLARELATAGLTIEDGIATRLRKDGEAELSIAVELETGTVSVRVSTSQDVQISADMERSVPEQNTQEHVARVREELRSAATELAEKRVDAATEALRKAATAHLEGQLRDVRRELDQVVHRVTSAALKERAAQIGEIESIDENAADGTLVIKVKV